jgi:Ca-activated chloride channel family protein
MAMRGRQSLALLAGLFFGTGSKLNVDNVVGSIDGTVRDQAGKAVAGASIVVVGTSFGARSGGDGKYRIAGVPAGTVSITARAIGFAPVTTQAVVRDGRATTVDFVLRAQAFELDELITSARPDVAQERRTAAAHKAMSYQPSAPMAMARGIAAARDFNTEEYRHFRDNGWQSSTRQPLSTFSIDVDAGSYSNVRRFLREGHLPPKDAVRVEEMLNYFRYQYPDPRGGDPFSITTELAEAPWRSGHKLARVGLQGQRLSLDQLPPTNLVFLIDVSGSMESPDKLPLVKSAFRLLVNQLRDEDRVAIVVYAGAAGLVLPSTSGGEKDRILSAIEGLEAGGSTAGGAGIQLAYQVARDHFIREGNNRVILATDGDFNVGVSSEGDLVRMIEERRSDGVFLTVLGFGTGNLKDNKMEQLANKGNGHYAYVDDLLEAKKVFVQELGATLLTIAKDVKIQVEFNPARVRSYRLVGYENRLLADRDFNDDTKDAGEMGAGHSVTALYEIVPAGALGDDDDGAVDPLKYQSRRPRETRASEDWFTVKVRYKEPNGSRSKLLERVVAQESRSTSVDFRFAAAVAQLGMLLRDSEFKGQSSYSGVLTLARGARGADEEGYRAEFIRLAEMAASLAGKGREVSDRGRGGR